MTQAPSYSKLRIPNSMGSFRLSVSASLNRDTNAFPNSRKLSCCAIKTALRLEGVERLYEMAKRSGSSSESNDGGSRDVTLFGAQLTWNHTIRSTLCHRPRAATLDSQEFCMLAVFQSSATWRAVYVRGWNVMLGISWISPVPL